MGSKWPVVRTTIKNIIEQTEPDHHNGYIKQRFRHLDNGVEEGFPVPDRGFFLMMEGGQAELPGCYRARGRMRVNVRLTITYQVSHDMGLIDEIIGSDAENIIGQLLKVSNWDQGTSGIELVGDGTTGNIESMPFEVLPLDEEIQILTFTFPVVYSRGTDSNTPTE